MDGPLNTSDLVKSIVADDLPLTFFDTLVNKIQTIEAGELQSLAQNYLKMEDWTTVIVS
jgi:predicted Zn-dependent peptidase